jgi:hypothetical protein
VKALPQAQSREEIWALLERSEGAG